jgi:hypothetical protein
MIYTSLSLVILMLVYESSLSKRPELSFNFRPNIQCSLNSDIFLNMR